MVDTDYESLPAKSAKPRRTYVRKKPPVALPSSSDHPSSSPQEVSEEDGNLGEVGRKRARKVGVEGRGRAGDKPRVSDRPARREMILISVARTEVIDFAVY